MLIKAIENPQIVKRTFEGKTNPEANKDPVTSKYYTSHKYAVVYYQYGIRHVETVVTKKDGQDWIEQHNFDREV